MRMRKPEGRMVRMKKDGREGYVSTVLKSNTGKRMKANGQKGTWTYLIQFSRTAESDAILAKREEFDYIPGLWRFD